MPDHVHRNLFRIHWWRGPSLRGLVKIMFYFPYFSCVLAAQWVEGWIWTQTRGFSRREQKHQTITRCSCIQYTFILSISLKNITRCLRLVVYMLSHIITNENLSWYITNHCDFLWGEKDKRHVVANRCIPSIPGVLYPHHPMHRNQTCILLQGKNAESYPPGEKSIHEGKMQKSIHLVYRIAKT